MHLIIYPLAHPSTIAVPQEGLVRPLGLITTKTALMPPYRAIGCPHAPPFSLTPGRLLAVKRAP